MKMKAEYLPQNKIKIITNSYIFLKSIIFIFKSNILNRLVSIYFYFFVATLIFSCSNKSNIDLGEWTGQLKLKDTVVLPFNFVIDLQNDDYEFTVVNGAETISLKYDEDLSSNDYYVFHFDIFETYLSFHVIDGVKMIGTFVNESRKDHKKIPFEGYKKNSENKNQNDLESPIFNGKWHVEFNFKDPGSYPAIGEFLDVNDIMIGTFRTETGDYRFLSGYAKDKRLVLSAFDGSHLFLFEADYLGDSLYGKFYSGSHWETNWFGVRNDSFELASPYELTQLISDEPVNFTKKDLEGNDFYFPNDSLKGKVVIIQIFGSWCPNCLDETNFYNELYENYSDKGLELIAIGYEKQDRLQERIERLKRYRNRMEIKYPLLVGGEASKEQASIDFPMFNKISSFPTSIYFNRKGEVVKIHTGFNGPGTGETYKNYVERTRTMIEHMLVE